jgi:Ca2+-dependent lipid-binding protein
LDESEIQDLIGELPAWLAFRDVERGGWVNKVLAAAWPYLDVATSDVIVAALDPVLRATRPSFLTALRFEKFSFGSVPAKIEGVKVFDTVNDGAVEIDLSVFWKGDPDVVLGVRAAQDTLSVPVSLTEFECAFTLRLIFAPLIGVFPCFGALTIALVDEPKLDFDLRVVGGDVTLVPGLKESLRTYIKALIASWMVWPRCITVAIPGTGYTLPES